MDIYLTTPYSSTFEPGSHNMYIYISLQVALGLEKVPNVTEFV